MLLQNESRDVEGKDNFAAALFFLQKVFSRNILEVACNCGIMDNEEE